MNSYMELQFLVVLGIWIVFWWIVKFILSIIRHRRCRIALEIYRPTKESALTYFKTADIDKTLELVLAAGGQILYPKTSNGDLGFVAEFENTEGDRNYLTSSIGKLTDKC
jgi:hypothetical protein